MTQRRGSAGFTLIEMLVALTLLALLATGIVTTFRLGQRTYGQLVENRRGDLEVVTAQRFLRQALESAYPFALGAGQTRFGLEGAPDRVEVTAMSPQAVALGHYRYALFLRPREDRGFDLVVRSDVDRHGFANERAAGEEVLIERVASVRWSYLGAARGARRPEWQTRWEQRKVPALIRLEVAFPEGDSRTWPELLVATRVTDDAQCEFDVVAQACREGT
jgi:prepilin-type N-terminal cleavage/methylation domain-containing protein